MTYYPTVRFEWDQSKDESNRRKHGLGFDDAKSLFTSGNDYLELFDESHSDDEERFVAIGPIESGVIVIVWTERDAETIRIISARFATKSEIELFRQSMEGKP